MVLAIFLAMIAMTAMWLLDTLAASGGFAWLTIRRFPALFKGAITNSNGNRLVAGERLYLRCSAGMLAWGWQTVGWTQIFARLDIPLWWLPASVLTLFGPADTWFYWTHRWMHRPAVYREARGASRQPKADGLDRESFHPSESLTGAILIPALVLVVPIHYGALLAALAIMTVMGVTNHMGWEIAPRWLVHGRMGQWLITASHHQRHHEKYRCNFGLYFRLWDRICGTDRGLGDFSDEGGDRNVASARLGTT